MASRSSSADPARSVEPYRPSGPLFSLYRQANRLFEDVFREFEDGRETPDGTLAPQIDIIETGQDIRISAELPGVKEEDIYVGADHDMLTIRAEKHVERQEDRHTRHLSERAYGTFQRSLRLPGPIDPARVSAHFDRGVLTILVPRTERDSGRRRVTVDSGPPPGLREPEEASQARH